MTKMIAMIASIMLVSVARAAPLSTPDVVSEQIQTRGARSTVVSLDKSGQFDEILDLMGRGRERWIALAPAFAEGTDGADGEGLGVDLARALLVTPAAVLRVLQPGDWESSVISVGHVCGVPFIEPPAGYDAAYVRQAIRSLARVRDPKLRELKAECLKALQS